MVDVTAASDPEADDGTGGVAGPCQSCMARHMRYAKAGDAGPVSRLQSAAPVRTAAFSSEECMSEAMRCFACSCVNHQTAELGASVAIVIQVPLQRPSTPSRRTMDATTSNPVISAGATLPVGTLALPASMALPREAPLLVHGAASVPLWLAPTCEPVQTLSGATAAILRPASNPNEDKVLLRPASNQNEDKVRK
eukprot:CAMPEP_0115830596 /NCGR_PEP_ID=MMETSP0287-20121206/1698_1 /TAXON_ID=412157 /ORGANISM="Chrysochromulina rotalis, Strain UIO044" /LENGTH=194 /DNA_ID=CAMNT_0003283903 /DNA_START=565 /DNA_END=1146 /DNA_ORIENTATION=-